MAASHSVTAIKRSSQSNLEFCETAHVYVDERAKDKTGGPGGYLLQEIFVYYMA